MIPDDNSDFIISNNGNGYLSCLPIVASAHEVAVVGGEGETGLAQEEPSGEGATTWHVVVILVISHFDNKN